MSGQLAVSSQFLEPKQPAVCLLNTMKQFRNILTIVSIVASFIANAGEQSAGKAKGTVNQPIAAELQPLQGTWEGVLIGDKARQKITITITGNSLHFHRDKNFWFDTTITLPAGAGPMQLHATIKASAPSQGNSTGQVVKAFFKVENGTFTLITMGDDDEEAPKNFEDIKVQEMTRYELKKAQPQKKNPPPPKTE